MPTKTGLADGAASQGRTLRHHGLDEMQASAVLSQQVVVRLGGGHEAGHLLEFDQRLNEADEDEVITAVQRLGRFDRRDGRILPLDFGQKEAFQMPEAGFLDGPAHEGRLLLQNHLGDEVASLDRQPFHGRLAFGQKAASHRDHEEPSEQGEGHADGGDLEHAHPRHVALAHHAVHDEVRGGADERTHAAEDGCVTQGDEQFRRRQTALLGVAGDDRRQHQNQGDVVQERAQRRHGQHQTGQDARLGCLAAQADAAEPIEQPRAADRFAHDKQRRDGQHRRVGEAGDGFFNRQDAGQQQDRHGQEQQEVGREPVEEQRHDEQADHAHRDPAVGRHPIVPSASSRAAPCPLPP